jgi:hypothetical protein
MSVTTPARQKKWSRKPIDPDSPSVCHGVYFSQRQLAALKRFAAEQDVTINRFVRDAVGAYMRQLREEQKAVQR